MSILSILFFITAILYSSVGFGGGSTYLALLLIWGVPYTIFPIIALSCNIIVVSGNCYNYIRAGNLNLKLLIPYLIGSIPLAFIGGSLPVEKKYFEILLFLVLSLAGCLLLINFKSYDDKQESYKNIHFSLGHYWWNIRFYFRNCWYWWWYFPKPYSIFNKSCKTKTYSHTASLFILINSVFGIIGQLTKNLNFSEVYSFFYLLIAVLIGGQIGNYLNLKIFPTRLLALITSGLVLFVAIRMGFKLI